MLVLDENHGISAGTLYQLGFLTKTQYDEIAAQIATDGSADDISFAYDKILAHSFYLLAACDRYTEQENGTFSYLPDDAVNEEVLAERAVELKISGIICPKADSDHADLSTAVAYTSALTDFLISHTDESAVIQAQEQDSTKNVLTGMHFTSPTDTAKAQDAADYLRNLSISEKASFYRLMMYYGAGNTGNSQADMTHAQAANRAAATEKVEASEEGAMAAALEQWLDNNPDQEILLKIYDESLSGSTYEDNLTAFGKVSYEAPASISIYADSFEAKDAIAVCIEIYNQTVSEADAITYTDYVAMLTSSITSIIDGISYVLVAFVAISLLVSCIMIGIITHISVMEQTKEIGILRALGASKRNISQVFNAETFIIGCCAGVLGIGISLAALIPINHIIQKLSGIAELRAQLSFSHSAWLIVLSILITMIGGLLPARNAAKKDPVIALRSE